MSWEFAKLNKMVDAALALERLVVVEMPRGSGKTPWVKWLLDNRPNGLTHRKMQVIVPAQNMKFSCYGICEQRVRIGLRGNSAPSLICDEWGNMDPQELKTLMERYPDMEVVVIGTDVPDLGGIRIAWDPEGDKLRQRIVNLLCKEPPAELLLPSRIEDLHKWIGREVLGCR